MSGIRFEDRPHFYNHSFTVSMDFGARGTASCALGRKNGVHSLEAGRLTIDPRIAKRNIDFGNLGVANLRGRVDLDKGRVPLPEAEVLSLESQTADFMLGTLRIANATVKPSVLLVTRLLSLAFDDLVRVFTSALSKWTADAGECPFVAGAFD
jgi:hypothetical protein